jgi:hypothetical protein
MTGVFADSGYPVTLRIRDGETHVELTTSLAYVEPWPSGGWAVKLVNHALTVADNRPRLKANDPVCATTPAQGPLLQANGPLLLHDVDDLVHARDVLVLHEC